MANETKSIVLPWRPKSELDELIMRIGEALQAEHRIMEHYDLGHKIIALRPTDYAGYKLILQCVTEGLVSPCTELNRTADLARLASKNFQIWPHRHALMSMLIEKERMQYYDDYERRLIREVLSSDAKNYHVWNYQITLLHILPRVDWKGEHKWIEDSLDKDLLNNSYWAYRLICVKHLLESKTIDHMQDISYIDHALQRTPVNQAIWDYIKGLYNWFSNNTSMKGPLRDLYALTCKYTTPPTPIVSAGVYQRVLFLSQYPEDIELVRSLVTSLTMVQNNTRLWAILKDSIV